MGSAISLPKLLPSKITSKEEFNLGNKEISQLADSLFTFMYKESENLEREVLDIVDHKSEYIIELSHLIDNHFNIIGFTSQTTTPGEIYFIKKKIRDDFISHDTKEHASKNENASRIIASFFIRIFQILGALLLVLKNVNLNDQGSSNTSYRREILGQQLLGQRGGATIPESLGPFEALRSVAKPIDDQEIKDILKLLSKVESEYYLIKLSDNLFFYLKKIEYKTDSDLEARVSTSDINKNQPGFIIKLKNKEAASVSKPSNNPSTPIYKDFRIEISDFFPSITKREFLVAPTYISNLKIYPSSVSKKEQQEPYIVNFTFEYGINKKYAISQKDSGMIIKGIINTMDAADKSNIAKILEEYIVFWFNTTSDGRAFELYEGVTKKKGVASVFNPKDQIIKEQYEMLKDNRPSSQPHCIRRAIDLLESPDNLFKDLSSTTIINEKICRTEPKNNLKSVDALYGKKIDINKILQSVDKLELDAMYKTFGLDKNGEADALKEAIETLKKAFEKNTDTKSDAKRLEEVKVVTSKACKDNSVTVKPLTAMKLQTVSHQLLAFHVNNIVEIADLLKKLFKIEFKNGKWTPTGIHEKVLLGGFPLLDNYTDHARELLVNYYFGCEDIYQNGIKTVNEQISSVPVAPSVAPAPAVPAAASAAPVPPPVAPAP